MDLGEVGVDDYLAVELALHFGASVEAHLDFLVVGELDEFEDFVGQVFGVLLADCVSGYEVVDCFAASGECCCDDRSGGSGRFEEDVCHSFGVV